MRPEVPVYKRCCVCLPLRYGLIVWGYLKLVIECLAFTGMSIALMKQVRKFKSKEEYKVFTSDIVIACIITFIVFVDIILSLTFIIGCHMKNIKLMKIFYFYSQFLIVLTTIAGLYDFGLSIYTVQFYWEHASLFEYIFIGMLNLGVLLSYVVIQIYILLLVRSEIKKLDNGCQFRFNNNAAEAECSLKIKESNERFKEEEKVMERNIDWREDDHGIRLYV